MTEFDGKATFCQAASPISYSSRDTEETIDQILLHNCRGFHLCGWPAPAEVCETDDFGDGGFGTGGFGIF